jgi:hypothetical protein
MDDIDTISGDLTAVDPIPLLPPEIHEAWQRVEASPNRPNRP